MFRVYSTAIILCASVLVYGCDTGLTGSENKNQPPTTNLTVENINREDDFRLSSQINISWWGNDPDGYIVGYEYAINDTSEGSWTFTTRSDSTFILPITSGESEDEVLFKVRSVDDDGARDPNGASLVYPIVNSDPTISFNNTEIPPDTLFSISSFGWTVNDPDGLANIASTQIAINDRMNGWVDIPFSEDNEGRVFISLDVDNSSSGTKSADLFLGRSYTTGVDETGNKITIPGIEVGSINTAYIRTIDAAGAVSSIDSTSWYIKEKTSKVLFINDDGSNDSIENQERHLEYLNNNGINPDIWLINTGEVEQDKIALSEQFPQTINPTLVNTLADWDHIYWFSNDIDRNITYALEITSEFFAEGGTMFVTIPMKGISQTDEIFNFLPVDSIGVLTPGRSDFLINANTEISLTQQTQSILNPITERRLTSVYPLKPISGATSLFETDFKVTTVLGTIQDYTGFESVGIENPEGNLIYFGLDITQLGEDELTDFIDYVCVQRLGFSN